MYRSSVIAILILTVSAVANARFSAPVIIKNAPQAEGRYFDPHNHFNGVLRYRVLGGISQTGQHEIDAFLRRPEGQELKRLLRASDDEQVKSRILEYLAIHKINLVKADGGQAEGQRKKSRENSQRHRLLEQLEERLLKLLWQDLQAAKGNLQRDAERMAAGTQTLLQFLDCPPTNAMQDIRRLLQTVLTANPQNDFDAAYLARSLVKPHSLRIQLQATLDELAHEQIGYVEMSHSIGKFGLGSAGKKPSEGMLVDEITSLLLKAETEGGPQIRWLPMLRTGLLADDGDGRSMVLGKESGQCENSGPKLAAMLEPLTPGRDGKSDLERVLAEPLVVGFDMASPERSCYTQRGAEHFVAVLTIAFRVAQAKHKRLVAHVHVGEGFPVFASSDVNGTVSCKNLKAPREMQPLQIRYQGNQPLHFINAENNIEMLLNSVEAFRNGLKDKAVKFDEYVEVRFGHVTHATLGQAERMRELHVFADVNLTSNLATGALIRHGDDVEAGFGMLTAQPLSPGDLTKLAYRAKNARLFKDHSLIKLLLQGVPVVLGTDGAGVEYSSMKREYALADTIINAAWEDFNQDGIEFLVSDDKKIKLTNQLSPEELTWLKQAVSIKKLYENQYEHYRFISTPPRPGSRWPSAKPAQKIWKRLHGS